MKDRIFKFITAENITAAIFADEIGVQRSSISHILSGRNKPSFDFIAKIMRRYKSLNAEWLILGTGRMYKDAKQASLFEDIEQGGTGQPLDDRINSTDDKEGLSDDGTELAKMPLGKRSLEDYKSDNDRVNHGINEDDKAVYGKHVIPADPDIERIIIFYADKSFSDYVRRK